MKKAAGFLLLTFHFSLFTCFAQHYTRTDTIPVYENGDTLKNAWAGGHDYVQLSDVDLNFDGIKDLFVFDKTGNKITAYINGGTPGKTDYKHAFQYQSFFQSFSPPLAYWVLFVDYDNDGKEDIFSGATFPDPAGIRVYKNASVPPNTLSFPMAKSVLRDTAAAFIPANSIGLPVIEDIDNDSDIDILTFHPGSFTMSWYKNLSQEKGYGSDSLIFAEVPGCWGHFSEGGSSSCTVALLACKEMNPDSVPSADTLAAHSNNGSTCSLCLDMDGDGDKELLLGQSSCCSMTLLTNGGTPSSANITSFTQTFPAGTSIVNVKTNPCGYFLDVNNDNKRDLIVSPSIANVSVNYESIWYYENTGTDNAPVFSRQTRSLLQEDMIDAGQGADPVFFDFDNDGLMDLLVSNYVLSYDSCPNSFLRGVLAYKNTGTASSPEFTLVNTDYASLDTQLPLITNKHLTFGDLDADGDLDMMAGDYDGHLHYLENTGGTGPAIFSTPPIMNYPDNTGTFIDVGGHAAPQLIDVDRDNDLDLLIGEKSGNINLYYNVGDSANPSFDSAAAVVNFGGVDVLKWNVTGYSVPFMYDSAGSYKLLVGSEAARLLGFNTGWIWKYDNIDGNLSGNFTLVDSMYQQIWEGPRMTVNGTDITNDGRMDLAVGNYCGGLAIYLADTLSTGIHENNQPSFDFSIYPNPSNGTFVIARNEVANQSHIEIYNTLGEKVGSWQLAAGRQEIQIDLSKEPKNIYFCKVSGEKFSRTKKLIVIK